MFEENSSEPGPVTSLSVIELKSLFDNGAEFELVDVRTPEECAIASLGGARPYEALAELPPDSAIIFYCHHGIRSRVAAERARLSGYKNVFNLEGGIDAWSRLIDPKIPRY